MRSASRLWGVELPGDEIDVTLPGRRHPRLKGVALHRPTDLDDLRAVRRLGIPATNPLRTSLDIGAVADPDTVGLVVEHFLVMKSFQLATLNRAITRHSARRAAGLGHLRLVLDDWCLGGKPPDSVLEPAVGRLLVDHALPAPIFHHVLGAARVPSSSTSPSSRSGSISRSTGGRITAVAVRSRPIGPGTRTSAGPAGSSFG